MKARPSQSSLSLIEDKSVGMHSKRFAALCRTLEPAPSICSRSAEALGWSRLRRHISYSHPTASTPYGPQVGSAPVRSAGTTRPLIPGICSTGQCMRRWLRSCVCARMQGKNQERWAHKGAGGSHTTYGTTMHTACRPFRISI